MRRLENRTYLGIPGETASVTTEVEGGGSVRVEVDGNLHPSTTSFPLKDNAGDETIMSITLFGDTGESCIVGISEVDGGVDGDLLMCQPHDPAPTHIYRFIVASVRGFRAFVKPRKAAGKKAAARKPKGKKRGNP